jgi:type I restriction enzyme M protein
MSDLSSTVKTIQNIMRKDAGVDGDAQRIAQLAWLIFLKIFDDKENDYEITNTNYKSPIPEPLRWRNWAKDDEGITGDELLNFVNNELFPNLKNLSYRNNKDTAYMIKSVFEDSFNYMKSGTLLRQVINTLSNSIDFSLAKDKHVFNEIYEKILNDLQSAGNAGEFYTPRALTQFIVEMVAPKLGEKVLDPACGTGGFLVNTIEFIRKNEKIKSIDDNEKLQNHIWGVEKKQLPHVLATTNLLLHDIELPSIEHDNLLNRSLTEWSSKNRIDVVVTNPPFGGMEEDGVEKNFPASFRTRETADLFLYLIMHILKSGGRCGMVLPDGSLTGEGVNQRIRQKLLEELNLHTIIRLPNSVFQPYATVATNLLFFEKGKPTKDIWYYEHRLPEGQKSYSKTKPIKYSELEPIKKWWKKRTENHVAWKVDIQTIIERNYDLDIKNPTKPEEAHEYSSTELLTLIRTSLKNSQILLNQLQEIVR